MRTLKSNATQIVYTSRPYTTPETELSTLAAVYRFLLLEKGGSHALINKAATQTEGANQDTKGKDSHVYR